METSKDTKTYIELTEENYFKALELGLIPMDWIKRQATKGCELLKRKDKVITYDGTILDFRNKYNAIEEQYQEVSSVEELNSLYLLKKKTRDEIIDEISNILDKNIIGYDIVMSVHDNKQCETYLEINDCVAVIENMYSLTLTFKEIKKILEDSSDYTLADFKSSYIHTLVIKKEKN